MNCRAYVEFFLATMIELKHNRIALTTIDACVFEEVVQDDLASGSPDLRSMCLCPRDHRFPILLVVALRVFTKLSRVSLAGHRNTDSSYEPGELPLLYPTVN